MAFCSPEYEICSDGSYVFRNFDNNCEFDECPLQSGLVIPPPLERLCNCIIIYELCPTSCPYFSNSITQSLTSLGFDTVMANASDCQIVEQQSCGTLIPNSLSYDEFCHKCQDEKPSPPAYPPLPPDYPYYTYDDNLQSGFTADPPLAPPPSPPVPPDGPPPFPPSVPSSPDIPPSLPLSPMNPSPFVPSPLSPFIPPASPPASPRARASRATLASRASLLLL